jgi:peptidyl-prolyl cis-trans isomerase C
MNVRLPVLILSLVLTLPATLARAQSEAALATVNGTIIPQSRLDRALAVLKQRGTQDTPELRETIRNELIMREVVQQESVKRGLDKLPEFAAALEEARKNLLVQVFVQDYMRRNPVADADVRKEYDRLAAAAAEKAEKKVMTFEEAAPKLRAALQQQSVQRALAELRKQATIE